MEYKGYLAQIGYDDSIRVLHGTVVGLRDVITFESDSIEGLEEEFHTSVDDYLAFCAERGEEPERTYSGNIAVRMTPKLHRLVYVSAMISNVSMNSWIIQNLASSVAGKADEIEILNLVGALGEELEPEPG